MELNDFISLIAHKRKTIFGIIAIFLVIGVGVIAVQRFKYSSKSQVLVVQEYNQNIDSYTASKSNEYLSNVLASVVSSNSFYDKVMNSSFNINSNYFGSNTKDQMKEWQKTIDAKSIGDSGIISITAFHPDRSEAERIVRAATYVLMTQHTAYDGTGDSVKIRLIDQPITSNFPVRPNIPVVLGLSFGLGVVCGLLFVYLSSANDHLNKELISHEFKSANYLNQSNQNNFQPQSSHNHQSHESSFNAETPYGNKATVRRDFQVENDYLINNEETDFEQPKTFQGNINNVLNRF